MPLDKDALNTKGRRQNAAQPLGKMPGLASDKDVETTGREAARQPPGTAEAGVGKPPRT